MKKLLLLVLLLAALGCGSSSSTGMMATPTANIAGTYPTGVLTNGDQVTFTNCTGDLILLEGVTIANNSDPTCVNPDPLVITQDGNVWQSALQFFTCAAVIGTVNRSGTVSGDRIDGTITFDISNGIREIQSIVNGAAGSGGTIVMLIPTVRVVGASTGMCSLVPPMEVVYSQSRSSKSGSIGLLGNWK